MLSLDRPRAAYKAGCERTIFILIAQHGRQCTVPAVSCTEGLDDLRLDGSAARSRAVERVDSLQCGPPVSSKQSLQQGKP